jgi:hypothetical protein
VQAVVHAVFFDGGGEYEGVLDGEAGALPDVRCDGVGGVAQQCDAAFDEAG